MLNSVDIQIFPSITEYPICFRVGGSDQERSSLKSSLTSLLYLCWRSRCIPVSLNSFDVYWWNQITLLVKSFLVITSPLLRIRIVNCAWNFSINATKCENLTKRFSKLSDNNECWFIFSKSQLRQDFWRSTSLTGKDMI